LAKHSVHYLHAFRLKPGDATWLCNTPLGPNKKSGRSRPDPAKFLVSSNSSAFSAFASSSISGSEFLIPRFSY
jgi:hypothetical protein